MRGCVIFKNFCKNKEKPLFLHLQRHRCRGWRSSQGQSQSPPCRQSWHEDDKEFICGGNTSIPKSLSASAKVARWKRFQYCIVLRIDCMSGKVYCQQITIIILYSWNRRFFKLIKMKTISSQSLVTGNKMMRKMILMNMVRIKTWLSQEPHWQGWLLPSSACKCFCYRLPFLAVLLLLLFNIIISRGAYYYLEAGVIVIVWWKWLPCSCYCYCHWCLPGCCDDTLPLPCHRHHRARLVFSFWWWKS